MYFDPDIQFYHHIDELALLLKWRTFVVMPHETRPTPDDGHWQNDLQLMRAGVLNYGFCAFSQVRHLQNMLSPFAVCVGLDAV